MTAAKQCEWAIECTLDDDLVASRRWFTGCRRDIELLEPPKQAQLQYCCFCGRKLFQNDDICIIEVDGRLRRRPQGGTDVTHG